VFSFLVVTKGAPGKLGLGFLEQLPADNGFVMVAQDNKLFLAAVVFLLVVQIVGGEGLFLDEVAAIFFVA